jgi:hypothetical protein
MLILPVAKFKDHFIREDGLVISSKGKVKKNFYKNEKGHLITCICIDNIKQNVDIKDLYAEAFFSDYDKDIHDVYFKDGNKYNFSLENVGIRTKIQTFLSGEKGIKKVNLKGNFIGWEAKTYDSKNKAVKYIASSKDTSEAGYEFCKDKYVKYKTEELFADLFDRNLEEKIPLFFK